MNTIADRTESNIKQKNVIRKIFFSLCVTTSSCKSLKDLPNIRESCLQTDEDNFEKESAFENILFIWLFLLVNERKLF